MSKTLPPYAHQTWMRYGRSVVIAPAGLPICQALGPDGPDLDATLQLIATAPELLRSAKTLCRALKIDRYADDFLALQELLEVIAKAEGGAQQ